MTTNLLVTAVVVSLVLVAGCLGGGVEEAGSDGDSGASSGDTAGESNADELSVGETDQLLREAGSFTATWSYSVTDSTGNTSTITNTYLVDIGENRSMETLSTSGPDARTDFETFYANGTAYTRYATDGEAFYQVQPQEADQFQSAIDRGSIGYGSIDDAEFVGTESFDGVTVDRYEYSDPTVWRQFGGGTFGADENVTVTDFTLVVLVDENGLARQTSWTLTGETETGETVTATWRYEVTGVGSTTVADPDWLDDAISQQAGEESALRERPTAIAE